jgi:vacuolar iron transporter family protein
MSDSSEPPAVHASEPHVGGLGQKLNWLRAGVLGANDGIVSTAGLVVGVAAATPHTGPILTAGVAGLVAGAASMALGEYVSVSTQRDTERALLVEEQRELEEMPEAELEELAAIYVAKGASIETARKLAEELTAHDAFAAHANAELGLDPKELTSPWHAAFSSAVAFTAGSILPIVAILVPPTGARILVTFGGAAGTGLDGCAECLPWWRAMGPSHDPSGCRRSDRDGRDFRRWSTPRRCRNLTV